jgi:hypothetical protein
MKTIRVATPATPATPKAEVTKPTPLTAEQIEAKRQERLARGKTHDCLCGCGTKVANHFAQGHDQRVRGFAVRAEAGKATEAEQAALAKAIAAGAIKQTGITKPNAVLLKKAA